MKETAVEWLLRNLDIDIRLLKHCRDTFEQAKEMEKQQQGYSEEDLREAFIEGYKQRAEKSDLIFDNASRMYAIALFKQIKNK